MTSSTFSVGDRVVFVRGGIGTIRDRVTTLADRWVVEVGSATVEVPVADESLHLRAPMARDDAQKLVERLCQRDKRGTRPSREGVPELTSLRQFGRCTPEQKAEYLRILYGSPKSLSTNEKHIAVTEEHTLLAELAEVLDVDVEDLRAAVRRGDPAITPKAPAFVAAPPFELAGWKRLGVFGTEGHLVVAEPGDQEVKRHRAKRGTWHAFVRPDEEDAQRNAALLAVHDVRRDDVARLLGEAKKIATVGVDGGELCIVAADALDDDIFVAETFERVAHQGMLGERGCTCGSGDGDGDYPVDAVREDGELVLVVVTFG